MKKFPPRKMLMDHFRPRKGGFKCTRERLRIVHPAPGGSQGSPETQQLLATPETKNNQPQRIHDREHRPVCASLTGYNSNLSARMARPAPPTWPASRWVYQSSISTIRSSIRVIQLR